MTEIENIILPEPTLRRLPWYLAYIEILKGTGVSTVSTTRISRALNVDSSQIAKDLSFLNIKGKPRIGYNISDLSQALSTFLGFSHEHRATSWWVLGQSRRRPVAGQGPGTLRTGYRSRV